MLGKVNEEKVIDLLKGCLFLAVPSLREPFGIVALEGMAAGKLVLASPIGGITEFLPVPPNKFVNPNVTDWVQALTEYLTISKNQPIISQENMTTAQNYSWEIVSDKYIALYNEVLQSE